MARTKTSTRNNTKTLTTSWRDRHLEKTIFLDFVFFGFFILFSFLLRKKLNESGKLTSFHCKTALVYVREQLRSSVRRDECLFDCIIYCLKLLPCWSIKGQCPHYIMDFVEKHNIYTLKVVFVEQHTHFNVDVSQRSQSQFKD